MVERKFLSRSMTPKTDRESSELRTETKPSSSKRIIQQNEARGDGAMYGETARIKSMMRTSKQKLMTKRKEDFLKDPPNEMTYGRRLALYLMKKPWYNPQLKNKSQSKSDITQDQDEESTDNPAFINKPSLEKAWAYFEHFTLPRYIYKPEDGRFPSQLEYARAGEDEVKTKLYSPIFTPISQMGDFGIGVGLYFSALRFLIVLTFLAGCISIPNILYYNSTEYSGDSDERFGNVEFYRPGVTTMLKGSAVCTNVEFVPCPDCTMDQFQNTPDRVLETSQGLLFVLKNNCTTPPFKEGMFNLGSFLVVLVGLFIMNRMQSRMSVQFDEDEQTAQDYSIQIHNPPSNANDPHEWIFYFENIFKDIHVTCCTICVNNDILLKALVERRERYRQLERKLPPGTSLDDNTISLIAATSERDRNGIQYFISLLFHPFGLFYDVPAIYSRIVVLTSKIRGLSQLQNPVTNVFITFETERGQRNALQTLSVGQYAALNNKVNVHEDVNYLFRKRHVLHITEPEEPSTVRWQDLNLKFGSRFKMMIITGLTVLAMNVSVTFIVALIRRQFGFVASAVAISFANMIFPEFCKRFTSLEPHKSESDYQTSLLVKLAFFRFVNTAIVINIITPFSYYLFANDEALLPLVYAILFADIIISNASQIFDPVGHFKRHFLGPREQTQPFMNRQFIGKPWYLAERYTNMTKVLFHGYYYCTIYPVGFFMCAAALFINYVCDKYCIMRIWARAPRIGTSINKINQLYILPAVVFSMVLMSSYWWSGFPYDNLCSLGQIDAIHVGKYDINSTGYSKTILGNETAYSYCNQNLFHQLRFPALSQFQPTGEWMSEDQALITNVFGWTSIFVLALIAIRFFWFGRKFYLGLFRGQYKVKSKDTGIKFSSVREISCYIPQVKSKEFSYPLIGSTVDEVDTELFEWKDPDKSHQYYNVVQDAKEILYGPNCNDHELPQNIFSTVYHYPVEEKNTEENGSDTLS